jgi:hypothetical protein
LLDGRYYTPSGFYFIDENGQASPIQSINSVKKILFYLLFAATQNVV